MSLAVGPGVAVASPSDPSGSSQSADSSDSSAESDTSESVDTSDAPDETGSTAEEADDSEDTAAIKDIDESDASNEAAEEADAEEPSATSEETREARKSSPSADVDDEPAVDDDTDIAEQPSSDATETAEADAPVAEPEAAMVAASEPEVATTELTAPVSAPTSLRSLVSTRPVTAHSIVTDLLTWVGLRSLADDLPVPATPVSALVQSMWLAVRQTQYTLNNQRPTAEATTSGPGPDGVVTGSLNAVDYDDAALVYSVAAAPEHGSVVIDAHGNFTYTPDADQPLLGDRFTITIDDTVGNPFHIHGLLGLLGFTRPTEVTITVAAPVTVDLTRDGVTVSTDTRGAVSVIDGRFTDQIVASAADAAAVMNALASSLGAADGFADPSAITATTAGVGSSVEHYYRYNETISGIKVLGSDVILVTDAGGAVTSLFNNYRGVGQGFDVTPAATVDEISELRVIVSTTYLGSGADYLAVESLLAQSTFTNDLIVYALDDVAAPSLAWRVVLQLPDTGDMSHAGATYVIDADGADAGTVIVTVSNVQDVSAVTTAKDWLGESRTITVDYTGSWFRTYKLVDATRNITTYKTSYGFFGFGGPVLPGTVVKRGWFSWDAGAVSAHANTAVVYDYYEDVLGRTSFDGQGALIEVSIRYSPSTSSVPYANAFWDASKQQFAFGNAGYLQSAVDVVGHEFTHAVVSYVVGDGGSVLDHGESGALNEAYADILGLLIEGKSGTDRWLIGEDSDYGIVRNLADPGSISTTGGVYRSHYANRYTGTGDDGGEHANSTIFSHAAYKMMTAVATSGISDETWSKVFYQSLYRLSPGAVFTDGRAAVLSSATAQGFSVDQLNAIRDAFDSVGIVAAATLSSIAA